MTWATLFLRSADEAAMLSALDAAGLMTETRVLLGYRKGDGPLLDEQPADDESYEPVYEVTRTPILASHTHALDMIGILPGKAGYHANLRVIGNVPTALAGVTIPKPAKAMRVWA